ncbi:hypothetical protein ABH930_003989 [Kitasatospora sp. GAS204A]|uniref:DUF4232 domain-containing protein n=1 Tax=unclassified Kitasatospora TaxID=2633591 RepID=UPI0024748AF1|nr:DUF4232 domain-containing protein [Kitasatospora sp. GAS204B]MDH6121939.1 hypothetical protein [Kitasatospora sp. GAS204B]
MKVSKAAAIAATTVALALGAVACNDDVPSTSNANPPATVAPAASQAPSAAAGGKSTAKPAAPVGSAKPAAPAGSAKPTAVSERCHTNELTADIQLQPDFPGKAMVMLTNKGSRTCTVYGYLGYGGLLADNSPVTLGTNRVAYPGQSVAAKLAPGTTAFSGLKWNSCDKADPSCHVLAGVTITPPDETTQLTASVLGTDGKPLPQLAVSAAGFTVGTLQPSNEGVVFTS